MCQPPPRQTFPRSARLRSRTAFRRVFAEGVSAGDRRMVLRVARSDADTARLGISASRRLGNAPQRNRIKRLVREVFRRLRHGLPPGTDWVVTPKPGPEPTLADLERSFTHLADRLVEKLDRAEPGGRVSSSRRPPVEAPPDPRNGL